LLSVFLVRFFALHSGCPSVVATARTVLVAISLLSAVLPSTAGLRPSVDWEPLGGSGNTRGDVTALARSEVDGRIAAGDGSGVRAGPPGGPFERVLRRGPVRDLAFGEDGSLWVATSRGLYRSDATFQSVESVTLAPGAEAREVARLAILSGVVAAATAAGAFVRVEDGAWQRVARGLPSGAAGALALRRSGAELELWVAVDGALWRVPLAARAGARAERVGISFASSAGGPVDIVFDLPGTEVAVVYATRLALKRSGAPGWETVRPVLPPGARATRIGFGLGRFWLATDRGLLEGPAVDGPWRRARPPLGTSAVSALLGGAREVHVASSVGLRTGRVAVPVRRAPRAASESPDDPGIRVVHQAALAYLRLQPARIDAMRRGVRERGWLPSVDLRLATSREDTRTTERDQAFLSGDLRHLVDRDHDRSRDVSVSLSFSWDLGDVSYHPEQIDVSREAREVLELRDDVLDEVTQLYFERRRVLAELSQADPGTDASRLRLRAAELAAGIDGWTGGWFSRNAAPVVH
jgi:hypothetical protein